MYNFYLGGKNSADIDHDVARRVLNVAPDVPDAALENRECLRRALALLVVQEGIRQFIDIGPGFPLIDGYPKDPTQHHHVHQITQRLDACRVVYVERDPVAAVHIEARLVHPGTHIAVICADLRQGAAVLANPKLTQLIDLDQPVCLVLSLLLHFIPDQDAPYRIVAAYRDRLPNGSYLILTHVTCDGRDDDTLKAITDAYASTNAPLVMRTKREISRFFNGLELVAPGLVFPAQWRPTRLEADYGNAANGGTRWVYAGVARKN
jgi:hypothetical protein